MTTVCELKPITNFPGYRVANSGQVWSDKTHRWLRPYLNGCGYYYVKLNDRKNHAIHRLVLETFVGPCPDGMEGCHDDGDRTNNQISNLRWDTKSENRKDAIEHGTAKYMPGENHPNAKLTEQVVRTIVYIYRTKILTQKEIAKLYDVSRSTVSYILSRRLWGHLWT